MNFASRCIASPERLQQPEVDSFTALLQAVMDSAEVRTDGGKLRNLLILPNPRRSCLSLSQFRSLRHAPR